MTGPRHRSGPGHDLQRFQALLQEVSGLELPETRLPDLQRAVNRALVATGLADADALYRHLRDRAGRPSLEVFVGDLTIGETHFFRNRPQFRALEHHILPELIERRRASRRLRVWSAACSTGEEPYSLAILLERLLPDRARWDVRILATDINRTALERARRGQYGTWSFRDVPDDVASAFFVRHGTTLEVAGRIREAVSFAHLNLAADTWPSAATATLDLDLVLCRNVLIYFATTEHQVAARLHGALADGGGSWSPRPSCPRPCSHHRGQPRRRRRLPQAAHPPRPAHRSRAPERTRNPGIDPEPRGARAGPPPPAAQPHEARGPSLPAPAPEGEPSRVAIGGGALVHTPRQGGGG